MNWAMVSGGSVEKQKPQKLKRKPLFDVNVTVSKQFCSKRRDRWPAISVESSSAPTTTSPRIIAPVFVSPTRTLSIRCGRMLAATLDGSAGAGLNGRSGCGSSASSGVLAVVRLAAIATPKITRMTSAPYTATKRGAGTRLTKGCVSETAVLITLGIVHLPPCLSRSSSWKPARRSAPN